MKRSTTDPILNLLAPIIAINSTISINGRGDLAGRVQREVQREVAPGAVQILHQLGEPRLIVVAVAGRAGRNPDVS